MEPKLSKAPQRAVRCPKCGRFMFNIVITMEKPPVEPLGMVKDFCCYNCKQRFSVLFAAADRDRSNDAAKMAEKLSESVK